MTRKYVASLGSKGQPECLPIITDLEPGVDQQKESIGDGTVDVDVELYEPVDDSDSDIDMGETENKDIMNQDESLMDIDSADSGNRLAATEYVEELYKFYRENEDANGLGLKAVTGDDYCRVVIQYPSDTVSKWVVHKNTASVLCMTTVKNEDNLQFSKILQAIKANFNDKFHEVRKNWDGGVMGSKSQAKTKGRGKAACQGSCSADEGLLFGGMELRGSTVGMVFILSGLVVY
ncbi:uncharacterized protein [Miscanthus floridulus]|uniref:uncharacterized protein isoform X3 n=1 Tax=Miscanthus floridulus TaxID=154761 RepID=UPI003459A443